MSVGAGVSARIPRRWVYLGQANVDGRVDRDKIYVGRGHGRFQRVQIRVERGPIEFYRVVVHYANGRSEKSTSGRESPPAARRAPLICAATIGP